MMKQFRPVFFTKRYRVRCRLKYRSWESFKFNERLSSKQPIMLRIFSKLHFLGSHSYVQSKWYNTEQRFLRRHKDKW